MTAGGMRLREPAPGCSFLPGVAPADPLTWTVMPALMLVAIVLANYARARRASAIEPAIALSGTSRNR